MNFPPSVSPCQSDAVTDPDLLGIKDALQGIPDDKMQDIVNGCKAIFDRCHAGRDGAGLIGGIVIEWFMSDVLKGCLPGFKVYHKGEADFLIAGQPVSFKKIQAGSEIAMHWSKNPEEKREHWQHPLLIFQQSGGQTWSSRGPTNPICSGIDWLRYLPAGFYIIDNKKIPEDWKSNFASNNKTNSVVTKDKVYLMLCKAYDEHLYVKIPKPEPNVVVNFTDIIHKSFGPD